MQREFKFRVWNTDDKSFQISNLDECGETSGGFLIIGYAGGICGESILQQFTGLCDVDGVDIYEGDILEGPMFTEEELKNMNEWPYKHSWWDRGLVKYYPHLARFGLEFYSPYGGEGYTGKDQHISDYARDNKVIGNIIQNKDLLT
jgi:hypothetical protein